MVSIEIIALVLTGLSITASIIYYANVLSNSNKTQKMQLETRQAQLFMNIYNTWSTKQYHRDREQLLYVWEFTDFDDFYKKYGVDVNPDDHAIWDMFSTHFGGIAVLIRRGLIDSEMVYDLMYESIIWFWEKYGTIFLRLRELSGNPKTWKDLELMYHEMKRLEAVEKAGLPEQKRITPTHYMSTHVKEKAT
jgi:hypothetical protein